MLIFFGFLSLMMAMVDVVCSLFGLSLTAVSWSPILFLGLGLIFVSLEALERGDSPSP